MTTQFLGTPNFLRRAEYDLYAGYGDMMASGSGKRTRSSTRTMYEPREQLDDAQFVSHVRHNKSKTGRTRPKTLGRLWKENDLQNTVVCSRFQCLRPGGFEAASGAVPLIHETTNDIRNRLPMYAFRLSSYPIGNYDGNGTIPAVMYQLESQRAGSTQSWDYKWVPNSDFTFGNQPEGTGNPVGNRAWITYQQGLAVTNDVNRFRYDYSHIEVLAYNQAAVPTKI